MISVVIPTLNEAVALPATLSALLAQPGEYEVIVVDGGSEDATVEIARSYKNVKIVESAPGRATQLNAGAEVAIGSMLLFLHADTLLPDNALRSLAQLEADTDMQWGGFHQQFSGNTWALRSISKIHNWRCQLTGVFYGDQAMFVRRQLFEFLGGFPDVTILEDIRLSEALLKVAQPTFLAGHVITDSRKFEQMGSVRSFIRCLTILACYELRLPIMGRSFFSPIR